MVVSTTQSRSPIAAYISAANTMNAANAPHNGSCPRHSQLA
jgi:hypothetical protein